MTSKRDKADEKRARNFIESFNTLSLAGQNKPRDADADADAGAGAGAGAGNSTQFHLPSGRFVGGFIPSPHVPSPSTPRYSNAIGIPPPPILYSRIPHPQHTSLTMQHALAGSLLPSTPLTPPRVPAHHPAAAFSHTLSALDIETPVPRSDCDPPPLPPQPPFHGNPKTPQPPKLLPPQIRRRAQSEPLSPVSSDNGGGTRQCCGMTTAGKQCRKQVKTSSANTHTDGDVFCHVHENKMREPSGFYDRKTGQTFIRFSDWIPEYLQPATQVALRAEMQKARTPSDVDGYIYAFEILDPAEKKLVHLKVGRATNLNRRMDQWGKQCGSKEQILRGFWPGGMDKGGVPMKGLVQAGPKGPWCHRLERLVHIELADLATSTPYLEEGYPNVDGSKQVKKGGKKDVKRCPDCDTAHKEIFSFERVMKGRYKGKEWESIVKPVIEKWGGFIEAYL
ncbi:hypothetical protein B0F90DRAFT_1383962 [Multifurca ochricompacta]|uniref:Bacteriophage T5 Orf172 DNA-binding domain-containing protein n=1 Tax=Multifurca ochricompacta TaxID=376703 RepID=A0AAD4QPT3_9AGAM|nr:hypothetical protein B0F90DRAFT_1383962 [Multifurca ochricompacta]